MVEIFLKEKEWYYIRDYIEQFYIKSESNVVGEIADLDETRVKIDYDLVEVLKCKNKNTINSSFWLGDDIYFICLSVEQ